MFEKECIPYAPALIESMRSLGYSFSSAIADLIDNSISANAKKIDIIAEPDVNPSLIILDDGDGMSQQQLYEAMRYGSSNPLDERAANDLGRFGLGLKSASLSQCKRLVVVSKQGKNICGYSWDIDYVIETGSWMLKGFSQEEIDSYPNIDKLKGYKHGTYVYLSEFDRIKEGTGNISETFNMNLSEMTDHLSLVFHRFIDEDGLVIAVNNSKIEAKDPFLSYHSSTQRKKEQSFVIKGEKIKLKPFILPHISKLSNADLEKVGGSESLKNNQGFYVYRSKRLIVWGTWFRLERKDELNKLARVRVDIPNTLDYMWSIDIKKSTAALPDVIKKNMYSAVYESILSSENVHIYRGRKDTKNKDVDYIWERIVKRDKSEYVINRNLPQLQLLASTLDEQQLKMLDSFINKLEEYFPASSLYVDTANGKLKEKPSEHSKKEIDEVWSELQEQIKFVRKNNLDEALYYKLFLKTEPFCNYEEIKNRILKELEKYE